MFTPNDRLESLLPSVVKKKKGLSIMISEDEIWNKNVIKVGCGRGSVEILKDKKKIVSS